MGLFAECSALCMAVPFRLQLVPPWNVESPFGLPRHLGSRWFRSRLLGCVCFASRTVRVCVARRTTPRCITAPAKHLTAIPPVRTKTKWEPQKENGSHEVWSTQVIQRRDVITKHQDTLHHPSFPTIYFNPRPARNKFKTSRPAQTLRGWSTQSAGAPSAQQLPAYAHRAHAHSQQQPLFEVRWRNAFGHGLACPDG